MAFSDIVGQSLIKEQLQGAIRSGKIGHAYIICGENRSGKEFIAQKVKNGLVFLFYLARSAFQKKDPKLMPSDESLADSAFSKITAYLASAN